MERSDSITQRSLPLVWSQIYNGAMKTFIPALAVLMILLATPARAAQIRVYCHSVLINDLYVDVRGTLYLENSGGPQSRASGNLRITLNSSTNQESPRVYGGYYDDGTFQIAELRTTSSNIREIYMDFKAGLHQSKSYVETMNGTWFKMGCKIE
jgi:hypothetical protein